MNCQNKAEFNHGSHAAGIAAGRDGIAPHAGIISINNSSEVCVENECFRIIVFDMMEVSQFLIDLQKEYKAAGKPQIVAVNMSFGKSRGYPGVCDEDYEPYAEAFDILLKNDMIPVAASGNNGYIDSIPAYGCISNAFTVGALADNPSPMIRSSSNHGQLVDILAPGTKIWSALYADDGKDTTACSGINCYGFKNGTSMAAPMVSGAFAILKQANPNLSVSQMESQIKAMSSKTANYRQANKNVPEHTFPYDIPVLDFSGIEKYVALVPEPEDKPVFWPLDLPALPRTGFSAKNLQIMDAVPKDLRYEPVGLILEIPVLDVQTEIVEVPVWEGEFAVTWLGDSVGLLEGSARPGNGTAVLAAHNHLNTKEAGPFAFLSSLEEGERIFIRDAQNDLQTYSVYANEKIAETDFEALQKLSIIH